MQRARVLSLISILLLVALPCRAAPAASARRFTLEPVFPMTGGETKYDFDQSGYFDSTQTQYGRVASRLQFPLNVYMVGGRAGVTGTRPDGGIWELEGEVLTSVSDPRSAMKDSDWETLINPPGFDGMISYTESDARMSSLTFGLTTRLSLMVHGPWRLDGVVGYRHMRIEQNIYGVRGWQLDDQFRRHDFSYPDTLHALYYKVTYGLPSVGVRAEYSATPNLTLSLTTQLMQVAASDVDDHLLRKKRSTSDGTGAGYMVTGGGRWYFRNPATGPATFLGLEGEWVHGTVNAQQTQRWYGDDPATPNYNDTGNVLTGLTHDFTLSTWSLGLRVGVAL